MSSVHAALKGTRVAYLVIEAMHFFAWFISMIVEQVVATGADGTEIRLEHLLLALHFVAPIAAIALEHEEGKRLSGWQFFIALTVFGTDLWSLLEAVLHLESVVYPQYVSLVRALAGVGLALSSLWLVWYAIAYVHYRSKLPVDDKGYKKLDEPEMQVISNAAGTYVPQQPTQSFSGPQLKRK